MNIFILDDARSIEQALRDGGQSTREEAICSIARHHEDAFDVVCTSSKFDIWILDNDLGRNKYGTMEEGIDFLKKAIQLCPNKIPSKVVSCSANSSRRADIEALFRNWEENGRRPLTPIGAE